jgi:hypothetical protein
MTRRRIIGAVLIALAVLGVIAFMAFEYVVRQWANESYDPSKNSHNIYLSGTITPSSTHPLSGFWKNECGQDFGLAIAAAGTSLYSVSFCGPGGCSKPGYYRPNTTIVGDPEYKLDSSASSITLHNQDGRELQFKKCWPAKGDA